MKRIGIILLYITIACTGTDFNPITLYKKYKAAAAYHTNDLDTARGLYDELLINNDSEALYNAGKTLYKQQQFAKSAAHFDHVLSTPGSDEIKKRAAFNSGNSRVHLQEWQEALKSYEQVLAFEPDHAQANEMVDRIKKILEEQQKQDEQNQQQKKDQEKKDKNQKQNKNQDQQNNQNQDKQQQDNKQNEQQQNAENNNKQDQQKSDQQEQKDSNNDQSNEKNEQDKSNKQADNENSADKQKGDEPDQSGQQQEDKSEQDLNEQQGESNGKQNNQPEQHVQPEDQQKGQPNNNQAEEKQQQVAAAQQTDQQQNEQLSPQEALLFKLLENADGQNAKALMKSQLQKEAPKHGQKNW